ncbi:PH domain-containing protein, partial [Luteimonas sp. A478]
YTRPWGINHLSTLSANAPNRWVSTFSKEVPAASRLGLIPALDRTGNLMATVYKSKIDWWLGAVLVIAMVASLLGALKVLSDSVWIAALIGGPGLIIPLIALVFTRYVIRDQQLIVCSGLFKWTIPISDISGITPTQDPISSPALSLDRLRITYGKSKSVLVSPRDKAGFLRQIESLRRSAV